MTISQGYRMAQTAYHKQPYFDYPYIGILDENEKEVINRLESNV